MPLNLFNALRLKWIDAILSIILITHTITPHCVLLLSDVMVLNDIIEQAAGRHSRASDRGGKWIDTS